MFDFRTSAGNAPVFFDLTAIPADQDQFEITLRVFRKGECTATEKVATVDWRDLGHVMFSRRVTLERLGYWQVESDDFIARPDVERAAA